MTLLQKIFYIASFIFLIGAFIYLGSKDFGAPPKKMTNNESFAAEYGIIKENLYVYKSGQDILEILNSETGIIFMGFKENKWSFKIAEILNETVKESSIKEIYYYNFKKDRSNNNTYYENIVKKLRNYLPILDNEIVNIYAPTVLFVKNGELIGYDDETSIVKGNINIEDYWNEEKIKSKKMEYKQYINKMIGD